MWIFGPITCPGIRTLNKFLESLPSSILHSDVGRGGCGCAILYRMVKEAALKRSIWTKLKRARPFGHLGERCTSYSSKQKGPEAVACLEPQPEGWNEQVGVGAEEQSGKDLVGLRRAFGFTWDRVTKDLCTEVTGLTQGFVGSRGLPTESGGKPEGCRRQCRAWEIGRGNAWKASFDGFRFLVTGSPARTVRLTEQALEAWGEGRGFEVMVLEAGRLNEKT